MYFFFKDLHFYRKCYIQLTCIKDLFLCLFIQILILKPAMKNRRNLFVILFAFAVAGFVNAQDCGYYSMSKGMVLGYQTLDAKGNLTGTTRTTCLGVDKIGAAIIFKVKSEYADAKNNNPSTREYEMRCEDGKFYMNMKSFVDPKSMEGFKDMEVSVDANDMMYPSSLSAGQSLPDASISISAGSGGMSLLNMVINITNRKVIGSESVTVPAGTFDCYKLMYDVETKMMFKINTTVSEYINKGVGSVKSETFDKKGKLVSTMQLVELKK